MVFCSWFVGRSEGGISLVVFEESETVIVESEVKFL